MDEDEKVAEALGIIRARLAKDKLLEELLDSLRLNVEQSGDLIEMCCADLIFLRVRDGEIAHAKMEDFVCQVLGCAIGTDETERLFSLTKKDNADIH